MHGHAHGNTLTQTVEKLAVLCLTTGNDTRFAFNFYTGSCIRVDPRFGHV